MDATRDMKILVVDDDPDVVEAISLSFGLQWPESSIVPAHDGREALRVFDRAHPDVVLLDIGLPDMDGFDVTRHIRERSDVPILMISARGEEIDKVRGLELGADDYVTKPFGTNELLARIQVALRHAAQVHLPQEPVITVGDLRLELAAHRVFLHDQEVHLTPTEYEILKTLATHAGKMLTHTLLLQKIWGPDQSQDVAKLRVFINQLRRKIEDDPSQPRYIVTEPGVGYRFGSEIDD
jgi:two-component system, OmpR family, KDP operon response regulator KdpE